MASRASADLFQQQHHATAPRTLQIPQLGQYECNCRERRGPDRGDPGPLRFASFLRSPRALWSARGPQQCSPQDQRSWYCTLPPLIPPRQHKLTRKDSSIQSIRNHHRRPLPRRNLLLRPHHQSRHRLQNRPRRPPILRRPHHPRRCRRHLRRPRILLRTHPAHPSLCETAGL